MAVRTGAPRGETPVLRVQLSHDQLSHDQRSASSGITLDGRLVMPVRTDASAAAGVVGVLRVVLRTIRGTALVIWDGSPIHTGQPITDDRARGAAQRLHRERLPGYAPDRTPDEGSWTDVKRVERKKCCCAALAELRCELRRATERLRYKRQIIRRCSAQCGYAVEATMSRSVTRISRIGTCALDL